DALPAAGIGLAEAGAVVPADPQRGLDRGEPGPRGRRTAVEQQRRGVERAGLREREEEGEDGGHTTRSIGAGRLLHRQENFFLDLQRSPRSRRPLSVNPIFALILAVLSLSPLDVGPGLGPPPPGPGLRFIDVG